MSRAERLVFVGEQARRIAREMSGSEYEFTPAFEEDIQKAVTQYAQRMATATESAIYAFSIRARDRLEAPRLIAYSGREMSRR